MGAVKTARSGGGERSLGTVYVYHNTFVNTSQANLIHGPPRQFTKLRFVNNIFFAPGAEQPKDANDLFENNFFGDPLLSDPAGLDFTPKESSPVIDKAIRLSGLNDDISGAAPDIGAIEFGLGWLGKTLKRPPEKGPWQ